jgi:hypothetical protein
MSRIADELYFAPEVTFNDLDLKTGARLPTQFYQRIAGFYLNPATALAKNKHAFPAGLLIVCAIDALAQFTTGSTGVTKRIEAFCMQIPDLAVGNNAEIFCRDFRHGLVHEARVKNGSEFNCDTTKLAHFDHDRLIVNPAMLAKDVLDLLKAYTAALNRDPAAKKILIKKIERKFKFELNN